MSDELSLAFHLISDMAASCRAMCPITVGNLFLYAPNIFTPPPSPPLNRSVHRQFVSTMPTPQCITHTHTLEYIYTYIHVHNDANIMGKVHSVLHHGGSRDAWHQLVYTQALRSTFFCSFSISLYPPSERIPMYAIIHVCTMDWAVCGCGAVVFVVEVGLAF